MANIIASGAITAGTGVNLTGGTVTLAAGTGIGAPGSAIATNVTTLNATTDTGNIVITQASAFTLNALSLGFTDPSRIDRQRHPRDHHDGRHDGGGRVGPGCRHPPGGRGDPGRERRDPFNVSADTLALTASNGIGTAAAAA